MPGKSRRRTPSSLARKIETRRPRKTLVIYCEGERTEPVYLEALKRRPEVRNVASVDLRIEAEHGMPEALVSSAIKARKKSVDEEGEVDEFWCVFDVEWPRNHPRLREAVQQARNNSIELAISNPCFELWLILHFERRSSWLDNDDARKLRRQLDGASGKNLDPSKYMPFVRDAMDNAIALAQRHSRDGTGFPQDNPSSGMYLLITSTGAESWRRQGGSFG
jgi:hypothetical protein